MQSITDVVALDELDVDGAIRETAEDAGIDRSTFFKRSAGAAGGLMIGGGLLGALPAISAAATPASDVAILNFALTLEYLEAAFYKEAVSKGRLSGETRTFARLVSAHETTHVNYLRKALGSKAVKSPKFNFKGTNRTQSKFQATSFVLENTGVHAYLGQVGNIKSKSILAAAGSILTIEARHASAIAAIVQDDIRGGVVGKKGITPDGAFDTPLTKAQVLKAVKATGFIVG